MTKLFEEKIWTRFGPNYFGHDYIVGDIHGCYTLLDQELDRVKFDPATDRLFSVGDLCDRGPESVRALEYLDQPWFHPVCGNHDTFITLAYENEVSKGTDVALIPFWQQIGGAWWQSTTFEQRKRFYHHISNLPYMIEVVLPDQQIIGIVHAEIPPGYSWKRCVDEVEQGVSQTLDQIMWGRDRMLFGDDEAVTDIDQVFCGHTVIQRINEYRHRVKQQSVHDPSVPFYLGNSAFIDTGGYMAPDNGVDPPTGGHKGNPPYGLTLITLC